MKTQLALLLALSLAFFASSAAAVPLRLELQGSVVSADGTGVFDVGEAVELVLDLDLELPLELPEAFFSVTSASGAGAVGGDPIVLSDGALTSWQISDGFAFDLVGTGPGAGSSAFDGVELAPGVFEGADVAAFRALEASDVRELRLRVRTTVGSTSSLTRADVGVTAFAVIPEPATAGLLGAGLWLLGASRRGRSAGGR